MGSNYAGPIHGPRLLVHQKAATLGDLLGDVGDARRDTRVGLFTFVSFAFSPVQPTVR